MTRTRIQQGTFLNNTFTLGTRKYARVYPLMLRRSVTTISIHLIHSLVVSRAYFNLFVQWLRAQYLRYPDVRVILIAGIKVVASRTHIFVLICSRSWILSYHIVTLAYF